MLGLKIQAKTGMNELKDRSSTNSIDGTLNSSVINELNRVLNGLFWLQEL